MQRKERFTILSGKKPLAQMFDLADEDFKTAKNRYVQVIKGEHVQIKENIMIMTQQRISIKR